MRTRQEIIKAINESRSTVYTKEVTLEVLLDIRDLLTEYEDCNLKDHAKKECHHFR